MLTSELVANDINPIYMKTFSFSSANFVQIEFKVLIYSKSGSLNVKLDPAQSKLIGQAEFRIEDLHKVRLQTSAVSYLLRNPLNKGLDRACARRESEVMVRYDIVEQTSTII